MGQSFAIFGAGPGGLYTAWRLASSGNLQPGDSITLYEWGEYQFSDAHSGTRLPAGRICSHHYQNDPGSTYIEVGGMRYIEYDEQDYMQGGHALVTYSIQALGLNPQVIDFNTTDNPLFFLRGVHFYSKQLGQPDGQGGVFKAPYNTPGNNEHPADVLYGNISKLITGDAVDPQPPTSPRVTDCAFYGAGTLPPDFNSYVYNPGDIASNVGYWNVFYDQASNESYLYASDAGGYASNTINWNAANAAVYNGEFAPGGSFKTLKTGYSSLFTTMFEATQAAAASAGITLNLVQGTRLHSIWLSDGVPTFQLALAAAPYEASGPAQSSDFAFLAMPPHSVELVAQATRYQGAPDGGQDVLNVKAVANMLDSVQTQPSYKVAMFFDTDWWNDPSVTYRPDLSGGDDVYGPTITDIPLRQVYYFGNNAPENQGQNVYGLLASYDDMRFTTFWNELELPVTARRETPWNLNVQPIVGAQPAPDTMARMLKLQLAKVHWGDANAAYQIPDPLETVYMDWGHNPFGAGYHAWAPHYDITEVMQKIRDLGALGGGAGGKLFLVGSAFSNDQAWVEGAFCTAESVLVDYFGFTPVVNTDKYPLICSC